MPAPALSGRLIREQKDVALALMISLRMKMVDKLGQCAAERTFAEQD
jgi:hypothetical protein